MGDQSSERVHQRDQPGYLSVSRTIGLPAASQPFGIAFVPDGSAAFVALEAIGQVLKLDPVSGNAGHGHSRWRAAARVRERRQQPRLCVVLHHGALARRGDGGRGDDGEWRGPRRRGGVLNAGDSGRVTTIVLKHSDDADFENQGSGIPHYLGAAVISPDGASAWVPSKKDNVKRGSLRSGTNLNHQNTVRAISSRIDLGSDSEVFAARIDHDNASLASAGAFDPYGVFLFVALETSREVAVVDAQGRAEFFRIGVGRAPQGIAVSPDGHRLYVNNFMDRTVGVFDITQVRVTK